MARTLSTDAVHGEIMNLLARMQIHSHSDRTRVIHAPGHGDAQCAMPIASA